jgi:hypothetical protein
MAMKVRRRSPQEKKRLSYNKDRRNWYGENDKSSRRNIARHKRFSHHVERQRERYLAAALGPVDADAGAVAEERLARARAQRGDRWRKVPDTQLGVYVAGKLARRVSRGISAPGTERGRIEKVRRNTVIHGTQPYQRWP